MASQVFIDRNAEFLNHYYDAADYAAADSLTKAQRFQTALTRMIGYRPQRVERGGANASELTSFDLSVLMDMLERVDKWINRKRRRTAGSILYANIDCTRR